MEAKKILLPTDFSPCASAALSTALFYADTLGAELHILHAIVRPEQEESLPFPDPDELERAMQKVAEVEMQKLLHTYKELPLDIVEITRRGITNSGVILDYIQKNEIDMTVMGTHGRTGLKHFFLGSVAEEVVRLSECPVITTRWVEGADPLKAVDRILVPVDFSEISEKSLTTAADLARFHSASATLVHVLEDYAFPQGWEAGAVLVDQRGADLEKLAGKYFAHDQKWETRVLMGPPVRTLLNYLESYPHDLLVCATHGFTGWGHVLLGSIAERLVRLAGCPVYTVK
ncbi:Universal stress protein [Sulfidibacter corallicola]|uniref:Universal stress protein n=1 Tax=Sulfidibacter corallicola TaxID=2818388 RepID=A0A8A4TC73_SULCO|nr:universal stress protein [Sulfidibacter corallicola]QTD47536.1 universal stress protein [Sulfidibacter corallicola]